MTDNAAALEHLALHGIRGRDAETCLRTLTLHGDLEATGAEIAGLAQNVPGRKLYEVLISNYGSDASRAALILSRDHATCIEMGWKPPEDLTDLV